MTNLTFRTLRADEIECRVGTINEKGLSLLLYKDARCDMNILDESGVKWQRHHSRENANCVVAIWDEDLEQWLEREDVGTPSNTEEQKGLASDSFKRACVNFGIGRELYTAPFIWIPTDKYTVAQRNGKPTTYDRFKVVSIEYDELRNITKLSIANTKTNKLVFSYGYENKKELKESICGNKARRDEIIAALKNQES